MLQHIDIVSYRGMSSLSELSNERTRYICLKRLCRICFGLVCSRMQDVRRLRKECYRQRRILLPYRYAWEGGESILHAGAV